MTCKCSQRCPPLYKPVLEALIKCLKRGYKCSPKRIVLEVERNMKNKKKCFQHLKIFKNVTRVLDDGIKTGVLKKVTTGEYRFSFSYKKVALKDHKMIKKRKKKLKKKVRNPSEDEDDDDEDEDEDEDEEGETGGGDSCDNGNKNKDDEKGECEQEDEEEKGNDNCACEKDNTKDSIMEEDEGDSENDGDDEGDEHSCKDTQMEEEKVNEGDADKGKVSESECVDKQEEMNRGENSGKADDDEFRSCEDVEMPLEQHFPKKRWRRSKSVLFAEDMDISEEEEDSQTISTSNSQHSKGTIPLVIIDDNIVDRDEEDREDQDAEIYYEHKMNVEPKKNVKKHRKVGVVIEHRDKHGNIIWDHKINLIRNENGAGQGHSTKTQSTTSKIFKRTNRRKEEPKTVRNRECPKAAYPRKYQMEELFDPPKYQKGDKQNDQAERQGENQREDQMKEKLNDQQEDQRDNRKVRQKLKRKLEGKDGDETKEQEYYCRRKQPDRLAKHRHRQYP